MEVLTIPYALSWRVDSHLYFFLARLMISSQYMMMIMRHNDLTGITRTDLFPPITRGISHSSELICANAFFKDAFSLDPGAYAFTGSLMGLGNLKIALSIILQIF